jgi:hypothetical protein
MFAHTIAYPILLLSCVNFSPFAISDLLKNPKVDLFVKYDLSNLTLSLNFSNLLLLNLLANLQALIYIESVMH